jgi:hypothetical protein
LQNLPKSQNVPDAAHLSSTGLNRRRTGRIQPAPQKGSSFVILGLLFFVMAVGFQNCAPTNSSTASASAPTSASMLQLNNSSLSSGQIYVDTRLATDGSNQDPPSFTVDTITDIQFDADASGAFLYDLDLTSGAITDVGSNHTLVRTLSADDLNAVLSVVTGGVLSSRQLLSSENLVCTQDFVNAYAQLISANTRYLLGQGSSGCPDEDLYQINLNAPVDGLNAPALLAAQLHSLVP